MENYKILQKGIFEKLSVFEERLNSMDATGWKAISISSDGGTLVVLLERKK
jgi:hypothetical protein